MRERQAFPVSIDREEYVELDDAGKDLANEHGGSRDMSGWMNSMVSSEPTGDEAAAGGCSGRGH